MDFYRRISCILVITSLFLCFLSACQTTPNQITLQVIDSNGTPLPNIQVNYGISRPETFASLGRTDEQGYVVWKDPPTGEQSLLIWRADTPDGVPAPQYISLKIRRSDFGTTITLQAEWKAGESVAKAVPSSSPQSTRE